MLGILLKSGLPLLLRYSLDDSSDSLQAATLQCLHNLLVCTAEEALLEDYSDTFTGLLLPALTPSVASDATEEEEERMSDEKLVELDTVKVHLQMVLTILPSFCYKYNLASLSAIPDLSPYIHASL